MERVVGANVEHGDWPHQQFRATRETRIKRQREEEGGEGVRE